MTIEHIVLYSCDNPVCTRRGSPVELKYKGKYPAGWIRVNAKLHPHVEEGQAGHEAYCSVQCFRDAVLGGVYDYLSTDNDPEAPPEVKARGEVKITMGGKEI